MRDIFWQECIRLGILPGDHIVIACSGGSDSAALTVLFNQLRLRFNLTLTLAHFNHRIREKEEGEKDIAAVRSLSGRYNIPLEIGSPTTPIASRNVESSARDARYAFLHALRDRLDAKYIALAHTANDQLETVYMRFLHGSGMAGLKGIAAKRGALIRPLLPIWKQALVDLLIEEGVSWNEDVSNSDTRYSRNLARMELDRLRQVNDRIPGALNRLGLRAMESLEVENSYLSLLIQYERRDSSGQIAFPLSIYTGLPGLIRRRLFFKWYDELMTGRVVKDFRLPERFFRQLNVSKPGSVLLRGYGVLFFKKGDGVILLRESDMRV